MRLLLYNVMIDFHNHILPDADDGAKNFEESIMMLRNARDQGITDVVNTIHFQHPKMEQKNTDYEHVSRIKNQLEVELSKQKININIHLGAEVFFNFNLLELLDNPLVTFNNGKYILVEFQTHQFPNGFDEYLFKVAISGLTPIIAHPERYKPIQEDCSIIQTLINSGCLMQIDGGSLLGHFGKKCRITAEEMLKMNMVHIIGSDSHNNRNRNFCLLESSNYAKKILNSDISDLVINNPRKIILGEKISIPEIKQIKRRSFLSSWYK